MRAKILLLPGNEAGESLCEVAEDVLTNISVAFGHTFSLTRDKIGAFSMRAYGAVLTEETVESAAQADGVLLGDGDLAGADDLMDELMISCKDRYFPLRDNRRFHIIKAQNLDPKTLNAAMRYAFYLAKEQELPLHTVAPSGRALNDWEAALAIQEKGQSDVTALALTPPKAVDMLINEPDEIGVLIVPPYAGSMMLAMATALHGAPMTLFDACVGIKSSVYAPVVEENASLSEKHINPLGMVSALAAMLKNSLHLERESDCIEAAVKNVLSAGWRTSDMPKGVTGQTIDSAQMLRLIIDQITLAGELLATSYGGAK